MPGHVAHHLVGDAKTCNDGNAAIKDHMDDVQVDAAGRAMPGEFGRASKASTADDRGGRPRKIQRYACASESLPLVVNDSVL